MARDRQRWGKDPRDRRRMKQRRAGARAPGTVAGTQGRVAAIREERGRNDGMRLVVTEDRYDLVVPGALRERVRSLFVKVNTARAHDEPGRGEVRSRILVVTFQDPQNGIVGLPVSRAEARRLRKCGFTHVAIQWIPMSARDDAAGAHPDGYDERAFRIAWYKPRGGHQRDGEKGGELVHGIYDELTVLEWVSENDLLALYEVPHLASQGFLPKRDEDREAENGIAAQAQAFFGRPMGPVHDERAFHRSRLFARFLALASNDRTATAMRFSATRRAAVRCAEIRNGSFSEQVFYFSAAHDLAFAVFHLPGARFILRVDLDARTASIEPFRADRNGLDEMIAYDRFLTDERFRRVTQAEFAAIANGIGIVTGTAAR